MSKVYIVDQYTGGYPQEQGGYVSGAPRYPLMFSSKTDAEEYVGAQYAAQLSTPHYPATWWTISESDLQGSFYAIPGYPQPYPGSAPNTPTDVTVTPSDANFVVSWTPSDPVSAETYTVSWENEESYSDSIDNIADSTLTVSGAAFQPAAPDNFYADPAASVAVFGETITFSVEAHNAFGYSTASDGVSIFGGYGPGIPAVPQNVTIEETGTGTGEDDSNVYTVSWEQPYPEGAGAPTGWLIGAFPASPTAPSGGPYLSVDTKVATVTASGTPSSGSFEYQAAAGVVSSLMVCAYNDVGSSPVSSPASES